jgi:energy-coupling factor transporter ATP-binding protein EcfA2
LSLASRSTAKAYGEETNMNDLLSASLTYFPTYEKREDAFRNHVHALIPRKYSGPELFWKDFGRISMAEISRLTRRPVAYITSNPRDGLAFGTPWQVLQAASLAAQSARRRELVVPDEIAQRFELREHRDQPLRTLSGGETVRLALAKAYMAAAYCRRLIIASPFSWLSLSNRRYLSQLLEHWRNLDYPVEILALEGEDSDAPIDASEISDGFLARQVDFSICFKDVRILLSSSLNPMVAGRTYARVKDLEIDLQSPCLIVGENGQGKSLIARALARAISFQGCAQISSRHDGGPVRLLFQDVIAQTLLRSFKAIGASAGFRNGTAALDIYSSLMQRLRACSEYPQHSDDPKEDCGDSSFPSLLEIKAILVAARLCGRPEALILDEPDWGLARAVAIAFVRAAIEVCHELGTPVMLISHKPWWRPVAASLIQVERSRKRLEDTRGEVFQVTLTPERL